MFKEKQYRGKHSKYPNVIANVSDDDKLAVFITTWGDTNATDSILTTVKDYYLSARTDKEVTSPFPLSKDLSLSANHLRIALMLASDNLYSVYNKDEYVAIAEVMAVSIHNRELNIAYAGGPSFLCQKPSAELVPYISSHHLGHDFTASKNYPLPKDFIGSDSKKEISVQSFRHDKNNTYYIVLADSLPIISAQDNMDSIEKKLKANSERPYWLGQWSF